MVHFEPAAERTEIIARYEEMRFGMFIHFGMITFLKKPFCGAVKGPLPPSEAYSPTDLDVDQWISVAKEAGMQYAVLTVKHWLGFALWDSEYTDYDVSSSGNETDVVAEFVKAGRRHGIEPCFLYTVGQDKAHREVRGMSEDEWYRHAYNQIAELLTNYGPITSIWFDGMGLGDYPQAQVQKTYDVVKSLQPDCLVVMHDPGIRGRWPTDVFQPGRRLPPPEGHNPWIKRDGKTYYVPMDVINTVVEGWFWKPNADLKPLTDLLSLYCDVTGRGANFTLSVAPDREGRLPADQVQRLMELAEAIGKMNE
jgi:alpha-L-fucosidase